MKKTSLERKIVQSFFFCLLFLLIGIDTGFGQAQNLSSPRHPMKDGSNLKSTVILKPVMADNGSIEVVENETNNACSAQQLVENFLVSGYINASNIKFDYYNSNQEWRNHPWSANASEKQLGYFNHGSSFFPLSERLILSKGHIMNAEGPNDDNSATDAINSTDRDREKAVTISTEKKTLSMPYSTC